MLTRSFVALAHPSLPPLFEVSGPHAPMVFAVLDGRVPGRVIADDLKNPKMAVVQTREGLAVPSRKSTRAFVDETLVALRADSMVGLVWREDGRDQTLESPARRVDRLDYACLDPAASALAKWRGALAPTMRVQRMTRELLERCRWRDLVVNATGSIDRFLETGTGVCLMIGDEIVAEGYAPYIGRRSAEVGVVTSETQRGRGYGTIAAAFLAAALAEQDLAMYWSCDADNTSSIRVAEKLGFQEPRSYAMLIYRSFQSSSTIGADGANA